MLELNYWHQYRSCGKMMKYSVVALVTSGVRSLCAPPKGKQSEGSSGLWNGYLNKLDTFIVIPIQLKHELQCCKQICTRQEFLHLGICWLASALFHVGGRSLFGKVYMGMFVHVHLFSDREIKGTMDQTHGWQFSWKQIAGRSAGMAICGNCASTTGAELHHVYWSQYKQAWSWQNETFINMKEINKYSNIEIEYILKNIK